MEPKNHMEKIFNQRDYKERRQALRNGMTEPERRLWQALRNQQMGVKFRRQHGIGHYIADFYCPERRLVIEVDGSSHDSSEAQHADQIRDAFMQSLGLTILRFTNHDVMHHLDAVHQQIIQQIAEHGTGRIK